MAFEALNGGERARVKSVAQGGQMSKFIYLPFFRHFYLTHTQFRANHRIKNQIMG